MLMNNIQLLKFSVNNWNHLYSLEQAILRSEAATGKHLSIEGNIRNNAFLDNQDTAVSINFYQIEGTPEYTKNKNGQMVLGKLTHQQDGLFTHLPVSEKVFEELRKNLMEYADIDGIHIVVTIGVESTDNQWANTDKLNILKLDYAMRGDA